MKWAHLSLKSADILLHQVNRVLWVMPVCHTESFAMGIVNNTSASLYKFHNLLIKFLASNIVLAKLTYFIIAFVNAAWVSSQAPK